jgi:hypothetical protein
MNRLFKKLFPEFIKVFTVKVNRENLFKRRFAIFLLAYNIILFDIRSVDIKFKKASENQITIIKFFISSHIGYIKKKS